MNNVDYYMMGGQFETVAGQALKLSEIDFDFYNTPDLIPEKDSGNLYQKTCPQLQIANADAAGSLTYYYVKQTNKSTGAVRFGWTVGTGMQDPTIDTGIGFWYRNPLSDKPAYTFSGQVLPDSPWEKTFAAVDYYMLVNPFPKAWDICKETDFVIAGLQETAPEKDSANEYQKIAAQIQVPNASSSGLIAYYYVKQTNKSTGAVRFGWTVGTGMATTLPVPIGRACWFRPPVANTKVTFFE